MTKEEMTRLIMGRKIDTLDSAGKAVDDLFSSIARDLAAGKTVRLPSLGSLSGEPTPERPGHNPATGEAITIAAGYRFKFKPGIELRDRVKREGT